MSWWRRKADEEAGDDILDLDDIVWRGINQHDRLDRLAEAARQTDGELPEPGERLYPPKHILPTVPLPVTPPQDDAPVNADDAHDQDAPPQPDADHNRSGQEALIETEIRNQIITEAMDAVLSFQAGHRKDPKDHDFNTEDLEAAIGEIADQTIANNAANAGVNIGANDGANAGVHTDHPLQQSSLASPLAQNSAEKAPDMSHAIRDVVADEIGLWLKDHMPRIIAETMAQASLEAKPAAKTSKKSPPAKSTKPKVKPKAAKKLAKTKKAKTPKN